MKAARVAAGLLLVAMTVAAAPGGDAAAATIVGEYTPGVTSATLGGRLTVNGYGVAGIGAHRFALDDGSSALGLCIQADVSHSTTANYQRSDNALNNGALDYLTWRYLQGGGPSDVDAAGMAVAVWGLIGAQRSGGGVIVTPGEISVEVAGVGRRNDIESAAARFVNEALRRRGPWALSDITVQDGAASVHLDGPAGAISGRPVTFRLAAASGAAAWEATADTNDNGVATVDVAAAGPIDGRTLTASAVGPGRSIELGAPGAQRFALAGTPVELSASHEFPAAPPSTTTTTSTSTSSTTSTTSTTAPTTTTTPAPTTTTPAPTTTSPTGTTVPVRTPPSTSEPSTTAPSTTTPSTTTPSTTTEPPDTVVTSPPEEVPPPNGPPTASTPPDMPVTGGSPRTVVRVGAALFALGSLATFAMAGTRQQRRPEDRSG